jgi:hypothetical protein
MRNPLEQLQAYQEQLTAAGIRAAVDGRDVNPPAVLLRPPTIHYRFGRGAYACDWEARLFLPDTGTEQALKAALPLLDKVQTALDGVITTAVPADYALADGGTAVGYTLTWSTH